MMWLDRPPLTIPSKVVSSVPDELRLNRRSAWADANKAGAIVDCFLEGPAFDQDDNLFMVDIPHGRILRLTGGGEWSVVSQYDGEPNGLKILADGRLLVADYRRGLVLIDPWTGRAEPKLERRNSESFKGLNDLTLSPDGMVYFTDQGQTGLHDPTGRVFRLHPDGRLDCLLDNCPSPNGVVLDANGRVLFVAMTRDNAVWRVPLLADGGVGKVGRFCSFFGTSGPDGMAIDRRGNLLVAHASLGSVFVIAPRGDLLARIVSASGPTCTNVALDPRRTERIVIVESSTGTVLEADLAALDI